jgi:hypothetical protein
LFTGIHFSLTSYEWGNWVTVQNKAKFFSRIGGTGALALGLILASQAVALAAPAISVTPSAGLKDVATVAVSGSGLSPDTLYHFGQCGAVSPDVLACNAATAVDVITDANGAAETPLTVHRVFDGILSDGSTITVDCGVVACLVGGNDDTGAGAGAPISFG